MNIEPINEKCVKNYIYHQIEADCASPEPNQPITGKAVTNINVTEKNKDMHIKINEISVYLLIRSEHSKNPDLVHNKESLITSEKIDNHMSGRKDISFKTKIPEEAMTSMEINGFDFGECFSILTLKQVTKGTYRVKKDSKEI